MTDEAKTPFYSKCGACAHVWIIAYLPMKMIAAARVMGAVHCPKCGEGPKNIFPAKQDEGRLLDPRDVETVNAAVNCQGAN